jgi:hypothetical protein
MGVSHATIYRRCSSRAAARCVASCTATCARVGRCATHEPSGCPKAAASLRDTLHISQRPPRRLTGRFQATGKAIWCSAAGPARSGPWWSATAALCCSLRYPTV